MSGTKVLSVLKHDFIVSIATAAATVVWLTASLASFAAPPDSDTGAKSPLKLTAKTDKASYLSTDPLKITLDLKNSSTQPVTVRFGSGQKYELLIQKVKAKGEAPETVWQSSRGFMFTQMVTFNTVAPGKSLNYIINFDGAKANTPVKLEKGKYQIDATIMTMGKDPKPHTVITFMVK